MEPEVDRTGVGPTCLVTGGNGFVGKHLVRRLLELGCSVRVLDLAEFAGNDPRVESFVGDVRSRSVLAAACAGVDTVFHTVAVIKTLTLARPEIRRLVYGVNVLGTESVIQACREMGVPKLVSTSSIVAAVDQPIRAGDETAPYVGDGGLPDLYSQTKSRAEKRVLAADDPRGLRTAAIRMGGVWGPGDGAMMVEDFLSHLASGQFKARIGDGTAVTDNIHVDSVVDAHFLAAQQLTEAPERVGGQAYFVSDDEPTNAVDWYRPLVEGLGYPWPKLRVPERAAYAAAYAAEVAHYLGGSYPTLTRRDVFAVCRDASFRIDKAREHLGYRPRTTAAEGLPPLLPQYRATIERMKAEATAAGR